MCVCVKKGHVAGGFCFVAWEAARQGLLLMCAVILDEAEPAKFTKMIVRF